LAATSTPAGPVHLNARFRKPLEPSADYFLPAERDELLAAAFSPRKAPTLSRSQRSPDARALASLRDAATEHGGATVVVGALPYGAHDRSGTIASLRAAVDAVTARGHVVLCEPASGLALAPERGIHATAHALASREYRNRPAGLLIELGLPPVDPAYEAFSAKAACRVVVGPHGINDPKGTAQLAIESDLEPFLRALAELPAGDSQRLSPGPVSRLANERARAIREQRAEGGLSEPFVSIELASLFEGGQLFLGNSLPIRDFALFAHSLCSPHVGVVHQRGHAGIDGYFAGAAGVRAAAAQQEPVVALFGDVTAAHDLGSLALLTQLGPLEAPLIVIVINNAGGRIFERLPIAKSGLPRLAFETLFLTAPALSVAAVAAAMGIVSTRCDNKSDFRAALTSALAAPRVTVIEAVVDQAADSADRAWFAEVLG
jgi:2-succinyl-5-enolpyruvyl-6-hydroxy-3-cyclohexene-1-carboxylate synthase